MTVYLVVWNGIDQNLLTEIISAGLDAKGLIGSFAVGTLKIDGKEVDP